MAWPLVRPCFFAHASSWASVVSGTRALTAGSTPVGGRPRPLFLSTDIDGVIITVYRNKRAEQVLLTLARP